MSGNAGSGYGAVFPLPFANLASVASYKPMAGFNHVVGPARFVGYLLPGADRCLVTVFKAAADDEALVTPPRKINRGLRSKHFSGPEPILSITPGRIPSKTRRLPSAKGEARSPNIARALKIEGHRLTDLPMLWSEQWRAIGLQTPTQVQAVGHPAQRLLERASGDRQRFVRPLHIGHDCGRAAGQKVEQLVLHDLGKVAERGETDRAWWRARGGLQRQHPLAHRHQPLPLCSSGNGILQAETGG